MTTHAPLVNLRGSRPADSGVRAASRAWWLPVVAIAVVAALLRIPYAGAPLSSDEGGFLMVARQWGHGSSLYGNYWVDRPPLLLALFRFADQVGALLPGPAGTPTALRLVGCVAVAVTVLAVGLAVRRVTSSRAAATWSALAAAGLLVSPLFGSDPVNGELLAAPFVALGTWLAIDSVLATDRRQAIRSAVLSGAAGFSAVLVKQNMLDVLVFAAVLLLVAWRTGHLGRRDVARRGLAFAGGGLVATVLILAGAALAGTRPGAVFFAMYPFRVRAAALLTHASIVGRLAKLDHLGLAELLSGSAFLLAALAVVVWSRRGRARTSVGFAVGVAVAGMAAYDVVSIVGGTSYWTHYLVQLAVPTALAAGLVVAAWPRVGRVLVAAGLASAAIAWTVGQTVQVSTPGAVVGSAIGRVARPGDTGVALLGDSDLLEVAHLSSPYRYPWSLPARTLDPRFEQLRALLAGPRAPTWVVVRQQASAGILGRPAISQVLTQRYHEVAHHCGRTVYLLDGVPRTPPTPTASCRRPMSGWPLTSSAGVPR